MIAALLVCAAAALPSAARPFDDRSMSRMAAADVVILGEVHDNPGHHRRQAEIVVSIAPQALVFEMIPPDLALDVAGGVRGHAGRLSRALRWSERGWPDFALYWPIFRAAPDVPIFGADVPRTAIRAALDGGAAAALGDSAPIFGLDRPLSGAERSVRMAAMADAHCGALPAEVLAPMIEAQRLRDGAIARAVLAAHAEAGGPVAVITGNGHARSDWGVPALLARAAPGLDVVTLGQFEAQPTGSLPFDYWSVSAAPERDDPCAALR